MLVPCKARYKRKALSKFYNAFYVPHLLALSPFWNFLARQIKELVGQIIFVTLSSFCLYLCGFLCVWCLYMELSICLLLSRSVGYAFNRIWKLYIIYFRPFYKKFFQLKLNFVSFFFLLLCSILILLRVYWVNKVSLIHSFITRLLGLIKTLESRREFCKVCHRARKASKVMEGI